MKLKRTDYIINTPGHDPRLPGRLRFAVLADFHNGDPGASLAMLRKDVPDAILIPGDVVNGYYPDEGCLLIDTCSNIRPFLEGCVEIAPTFMSLGNHECLMCSEDYDVIRSTGVKLLDNEWTEFIVPASGNADPDPTGSGTGGSDPDLLESGNAGSGHEYRILIGGLTSAYSISYRTFRERYNRENSEAGYERYPYHKRPRDILKYPTESAWLDDFERQPGYRILLSHHPEYWCMREPMLRDRIIDLVLSGHAHGGQWQLLGRGILAPGQGFFPKYTHGMHFGPRGRMIVSRGLHNPFAYIPRWGNPCELIYVETRND